MKIILFCSTILWSFPLVAQTIDSTQSSAVNFKSMQYDLFFTTQTPGGYTWTLTSRLGDILAKAIDRFGPRDTSYTILGVEINALQDRPQIWYPRGSKHIAIQLGRQAAGNTERAVYQLAHEAIHCLAPTGSLNANWLEEGIAVCFSEDYMMEVFGKIWLSDMETYRRAGQLVRSLLAIDENIIKQVRTVQPTISQITPQQLIDANSKVPSELAQELCKRF